MNCAKCINYKHDLFGGVCKKNKWQFNIIYKICCYYYDFRIRSKIQKFFICLKFKTNEQLKNKKFINCSPADEIMEDIKNNIPYKYSKAKMYNDIYNEI